LSDCGRWSSSGGVSAEICLHRRSVHLAMADLKFGRQWVIRSQTWSIRRLPSQSLQILLIRNVQEPEPMNFEDGGRCDKVSVSPSLRENGGDDCPRNAGLGSYVGMNESQPAPQKMPHRSVCRSANRRAGADRLASCPRASKRLSQQNQENNRRARGFALRYRGLKT